MKNQHTKTYQLTLHNVSCASCIKHIESALTQQLDSQQFAIHFATREITINHHNSPDTIIALLKKAGFEATLKKPGPKESLFKPLLKRAAAAGILGLIILLLSLSAWQPSLQQPLGQLFWSGIGILSAVTIYYSGGAIYKRAFLALLNHQATMDSLITMGTGAAWIYSMIICLAPHLAQTQHVYFEAALIIIALVNLGAALEERARKKTSQAIERLMDLQATTATRIKKNGDEVIIPIDQLKAGDIIRVKPGEKVAADGIIIEGQSTIDESMLTGEAIPAIKQQNDTVYASTINQSGSFLFEAKKVGTQTLFETIIQLVETAQNTKPPITRLADTVSAYFVPTVLVIAIITAITWWLLGFPARFILTTSMSVLVIACPCALGLAAPISIIASMGKAAKHGILIRSAAALQKASEINTLLFDKTGTITQGKPSVTTIVTTHSYNDHDLLHNAASLANYSNHPLSQAIVHYAKIQSITINPVENIQDMPGYGIEGIIRNQPILLGNHKFMQKNAIATSEQQAIINKHTLLGHTPIYLAINNQLAGIIFVADLIKPDAKHTISTLKDMGLNILMVTGDHQQTADAVARQVGIHHIIADVLPAEKSAAVRTLQKQQKIIGMVGRWY